MRGGEGGAFCRDAECTRLHTRAVLLPHVSAEEEEIRCGIGRFVSRGVSCSRETECAAEREVVCVCVWCAWRGEGGGEGREDEATSAWRGEGGGLSRRAKGFGGNENQKEKKTVGHCDSMGVVWRWREE